ASLGSSSETWRLRCGLYRRLLDPGPHRSPDLGVVSDPLSCQWRVVPVAATGLELPAPTATSAAARRCSDCALEALRLAADKKSGMSGARPWFSWMKAEIGRA